MESREGNIAQPEKKSRHASWKSIVGGDILATDFFRRQTKLLVLVMVLIIFYIHNRYACQQQMIEIDRLKKELTDLAQAIVDGKDIASDEVLSKHAPWVEELKKQYTFTQDNAMDILMQETGKVFAAVLEDAGVYKNTDQGRAAFVTFVDAVNQK